MWLVSYLRFSVKMLKGIDMIYELLIFYELFWSLMVSRSINEV